LACNNICAIIETELGCSFRVVNSEYTQGNKIALTIVYLSMEKDAIEEYRILTQQQQHQQAQDT
jgi:hypothetical protein